jgi:amino-acid N-acetyltransferase
MNQNANLDVVTPAQGLLRPARTSDVPQIRELIDQYASANLMLPRTLSDLYETVRDFVVFVEGEEVIGAGALHVDWDDLAELRSLAVSKDFQGQGIGRKICEALLEDAQRLGIGRIFALTYADAFFKSLGFRVVDKRMLPRKIWADCIHCHKYPICDEIAVIYDFKPYPEGPVGPPLEVPQVINLESLAPVTISRS